MKRWLIGLLLLLTGAAAHAELRVTATVSNLGALVRAVGGDGVSVTVLAPPNRDPHYLEARPGMMAALRRTDLLVAVGADLEVGWLPAALQGAANPGILPGNPGYFDGAAHVELIDPQPADRARGDVHVHGNPHYYLDPVRMARVGHALAESLAELDPERAERYRANANAFEEEVRARLPRWRAAVAVAPGAVLFHKDVDYLLRLLEVPALGYLEPLPGIPPTARHLQSLVEALQGRDGVIVHAPYHPARGPEFLARQLGWKAVQVSNYVSADGDAQAYFALIDRWVQALAQGRP